jgi:hypothetical protein
MEAIRRTLKAGALMQPWNRLNAFGFRECGHLFRYGEAQTDRGAHAGQTRGDQGKPVSFCKRPMRPVNLAGP